MMWIMIPW